MHHVLGHLYLLCKSRRIHHSVIENLGYSPFACYLGSLTATFAIVLPSFLVVLWICILFYKFKNNPGVTNALQWLKPIIIGMIGAAAVILITPDNFVDWATFDIHNRT